MMRKSAFLSIAIFTALMGAGMSSASASDASDPAGSITYVGEGTAQEAVNGGNDITPENSHKLSDDEVRDAFSVKDFALRDATLEEINKYYPEATAEEVEAFRNDEADQPVRRITNPICNNVDFYSIVRAGDNREYCFANAGSMSFYMPGIYKVCPGNNNGHVLYRTANLEYYNSPDRGPVYPRTTCFHFSVAVDVMAVTIN